MIPFPFEDGQILDWSDASSANDAQIALQRCFVDAGIFSCAQNVPDGEWPAIGGFSVDQSELSFFIYAFGQETKEHVKYSNVRFPVLRGVSAWGSYVIVLSSEGIIDFANSGFLPPASGSSSPRGRDGGCCLKICARCIHLSPGGVDSIRVYDGTAPSAFNTFRSGYSKGDTCSRGGKAYVCLRDVEPGGEWNQEDWSAVSMLDVGRRNPSFVINGDVNLLPGNNFMMSDGGDENGFSINAIPGAGMGPIPCVCEETRKIPEAFRSPDGHVRLFNDTCYDIDPKIETLSNGNRVGNIYLHAKCTACCTCDMYASIVNEKLASISDSLREIRAGEIDILNR